MSNFHVNYLTGSNTTGDGTPGNPWATLKYALENGPAIAGDVVKIAGSTTTDVDTAASPSTNLLTTIINTSVDLTGVLAVNDVIRISPNMVDGPEYDGWMLTEIVSINATSITTRAEWVFPDQATTNFTITKINDQIFKTTSNSEAIAPNTYVDVIVEGGYDETFTNVVGLTSIVKSDVAAGARSGSFYTFSSGTTGAVSTPLFKNFMFARWQFGINAAFANMAQADNLHLLNAAGTAGSNGPFVGPNSLLEFKIYLNDCDGAFPHSPANSYYWHQPVSLDYQAKRMAYISQNRDRSFVVSSGVVDGLVAYVTGTGSFGTVQVWTRAAALAINGDITLVALDQNALTNSTNKSSGITAGSAYINMNSLNFVRNGQTGDNYTFTPFVTWNDANPNSNCYLKLPTGKVVDDYLWCAPGSPELLSPSILTIEDDNGIWNSFTGNVLTKQNLVDQETGNSCLQVEYLAGNGYASFSATPTLAAFKSKVGSTKLTGVEIRCKQVNPLGSLNIYLQTIIGDGLGSLGLGVLPNNSDWNTITFSGDNDGFRYISNNNTLIPLAITTAVYLNKTVVLIDSITAIYS
jgi:hypothetical protein